jgi:hypothetical protein
LFLRIKVLGPLGEDLHIEKGPFLSVTTGVMRHAQVTPVDFGFDREYFLDKARSARSSEQIDTVTSG